MQPKRESTPFMRINGFCKKCCYETRVKYLIIIQKQIDESKEYVRVKAMVIGNHNHSDISDDIPKKSICKKLSLHKFIKII